MKKVLRVLVLGLMAALAATAVFAQERDRAKVYDDYEKNYQATTIEGKQKALAAAKEYIEKFNTPEDKAQVDYFKEAIPALEQAIKDLEQAQRVGAEQKKWNDLLVKFDTAFKAALKDKNWDNPIAAGKEALNFQPQYLDRKVVDNTKFDLSIVMAVIGYDLAEAKNNKYNNETVELSKKIIQQIESGQTSDKFGEYKTYQFKTDTYPDGKNNALGWMNYAIGYITFYGQKNPQAAAPYLFKASQYKSEPQNFPIVYELIGSQYYDEVAKLDQKRVEVQKANGDKDNEESLTLYALEKGYAERGADAYARAYKLVKDDAKQPKAYKDLLFSRLQQLYKFRHNDKTDGLDAYVASIMSKPFPNPTTAVEPIKEEDTATTPTTSTTPSNSTANGANGAKTAPASNTNVKTSATPNKTGDTTKTEASTKTTNTKTPTNKKPRKR